MVLHSSKPSEVIAGYALTERIGAGGYGEVWKAEAPGGLFKAVKLVYGFLDDERASQELKSLNRIKGVRHPFLVSLERIEVVDGQLVIVTELADMSLKDRYLECKQQGLVGIPREELLVYLHDAAQALDYMREKFSLQHLDIKPDNMLLVGGRVKVADFGLVKELHDATVSLMGGITPLYASPEAFDGRASWQSDQYSLAIVYQEMLTGILPFPGRTAAQLATQHMNSRPRLGCLPTNDQPIIARALSKDPKDRFPGCCDMISGLMTEARRNEPGAGASHDGHLSRRPTPDSEASNQRTEVVHELASHFGSKVEQTTSRGSPIHMTETAPKVPLDNYYAHHRTTAVVTTLPPLQGLPDQTELRPTLILGIGGTGARILRRLRQTLLERFGNLESAPAIRMLLLDTDSGELERATEGDDGSALPPRDLMAIPLRKAQEYRENPDKFLKWLSRRWIYNIPRSLRTEGIRPLGRLAFVDHSTYVFETWQSVIREITSAEALAATERATGTQVRGGAPRVFLVASIAGGTGSGIVLDAAYGIRKVLGDLNLPADDVCQLLAFSTPRAPAARDLATANALAFLCELHHYDRNKRFAGDPACGLPALAGAEAHLRNTYLLHLGDGLTDDSFNAAADVVAQYITIGSTTPAATFLDRCRHEEVTTDDEATQATAESHLRTMGLCQFSCSCGTLLSGTAETLCDNVLKAWRGDAEPTQSEHRARRCEINLGQEPDAPVYQRSDAEVEQLASDQADALEFTGKRLLDVSYGILERHLGSDTPSYCRRAAEKLLSQIPEASSQGLSPHLAAQAVDAVDAMLGPRKVASASSGPLTSFREMLDRHLQDVAEREGDDLREWLLKLVDEAKTTVTGARHAARWMANRFRALEEAAAECLKRLQAEADVAEQALSGPKPTDRKHAKSPDGSHAEALEKLVRYIDARLHEVALQGSRRLAQLFAARVGLAADTLTDFWRELGLWSQSLHAPSAAQTEEQPAEASDMAKILKGATVDTLRGQLAALSHKLDRSLGAGVLTHVGGIRGLMASRPEQQHDLIAAMRAEARAIVRSAMKEIDIAKVLLQARGGTLDASAPLKTWLESATPKLLSNGGAKRLLLMLPATGTAKQLHSTATQLGETFTTVPSPDGDVVLCYEVQQVPLDNVLASLIDRGPDYAEIAERLHTRVDVKWTPLTAGDAPSSDSGVGVALAAAKA